MMRFSRQPKNSPQMNSCRSSFSPAPDNPICSISALYAHPNRLRRCFSLRSSFASSTVTTSSRPGRKACTSRPKLSMCRSRACAGMMRSAMAITHRQAGDKLSGTVADVHRAQDEAAGVAHGLTIRAASGAFEHGSPHTNTGLLCTSHHPQDQCISAPASGQLHRTRSSSSGG